MFGIFKSFAEKRPIFKAGQWVQVKEEFFVDSGISSMPDYYPTFVKLKSDFFGNREYMVAVSSCKVYNGELKAEADNSVDYSRLLFAYSPLDNKETIKKLDCLVAKDIENKKRYEQERLERGRKAINDALATVECK